MIRTLFTIIQNIKITHTPPPLGRWNNNCDKSNKIKNFLANHDCCGDNLCGNPLYVKNLIEKEVKFKMAPFLGGANKVAAVPARVSDPICAFSGDKLANTSSVGAKEPKFK